MNSLSNLQTLISGQNYTKAKELLETQIIQAQATSETYYYLGVIAYFENQIGAAVQYLKKSVELDPKNTDASICLSVLLNDVGQYEGAKNVFEQANQSAVLQTTQLGSADLKFSLKHFELGDLYYRYKRYDEAIEEYTKASVLNPQDVEIKIRRAKAYSKKGFTSQALQELLVLKKQQPQNISVMIQLGLLHFSQNQFFEAEKEWVSVLQIDPTNSEVIPFLKLLNEKNHSPEKKSELQF